MHILTIYKWIFYIEIFRIVLACIKCSMSVICAYYFTSLLSNLHFRPSLSLQHCNTKVNNNQSPNISMLCYIHGLLIPCLCSHQAHKEEAMSTCDCQKQETSPTTSCSELSHELERILKGKQGRQLNS